jgi:hypothetical protein
MKAIVATVLSAWVALAAGVLLSILIAILS